MLHALHVFTGVIEVLVLGKQMILACALFHKVYVTRIV